MDRQPVFRLSVAAEYNHATTERPERENDNAILTVGSASLSNETGRQEGKLATVASNGNSGQSSLTTTGFCSKTHNSSLRSNY